MLKKLIWQQKPTLRSRLGEVMHSFEMLQQLTLNQRVPGSSPGAPTTQFSETSDWKSAERKAAFSAISRDFF